MKKSTPMYNAISPVTISTMTEFPLGAVSMPLPILTLRQQRTHDIPRHVGQAEVAALVAGDEPQVIQSQRVQHGRLDVVDVHRVFHHVPAPLISLAIGEAAAETAADEEQPAAELLVVAA